MNEKDPRTKDPRTKLDAIIKEEVDKKGIPDVSDRDESEEE